LRICLSRIWLYVLLSTSCPVAVSQTPGISFDRITTADGLSYDKVRSIIQDKQGFIWMGTVNGLNRYDGSRFKIFYANMNDSCALPDNRIQRLYEDSKGNLWICTLSGISLYNPVTEKFKNFYGYEAGGSRISYTCYDIIEYRQQYWVATIKGIRKLNLHSQRLDPVPGKPLTDFINSQVFYQLITTSSGNLMAASFEGLVQIQPGTNDYTIIPLHDGEPAHDRANNSLTYLAEDTEKNIWIGTWSGGLKRWDPLTQRFSTFLFSNKPAYTMNNNIARYLALSRQNNYLWVSSAGEGLHRFDMKQQYFQSWFTDDPNNNYGIPPGGVFCVFEDRQSRLWIGGDKGIYIYDPAKQLTLQKKIAWPGPDCKKEIACIYEDNNSYLISSWNCGLYRTDSSFKNTLPAGDMLNAWQQYKLPAYSIIRDHHKNIWLASGSGGLFWINEASNTLRRWGGNTGDTHANRSFRQLLQDNKGRVWIRSTTGLCYYDSARNDIAVFDHPVLDHAQLTDMKEDSKGHLWISIFCGDSKAALLYRINLHDDVVTTFHDPMLSPLTCASQRGLKKIFIDRDNTLWLSSTIGLFRMTNNGDKTSWQLYTEKDGLPAALCDGITAASDKYIWLGTASGLSLFNKQTGRSERNFSTSDGLLDTDLDGQYFYKDSHGRLFIAGLNGDLNLVEKMPATGATHEVPVVLTGIKILNKDYLPEHSPITGLRELAISYKQNNLQFEFAALDYTYPGQQEFAYRLEGLDKDWIYTRQPFAVYNNLAGGHYTFRVKASGGDGRWHEQEVALRLVVHPPFWQTWWFKSIAIVVTGLLIYGFVRRRVNITRKEGLLLQLKAEAETKALRSQMNPHFIFNCMNTIDAYILKNKQDEASDILQKFSGLMRQVLHNSRFDKIPLEEEIRALELYIELEECILENSFTHRITLPMALLEKTYAIPPLLLQPYAENAILHGLRHKEGKDGLLSIDIQLYENTIHCIIEDNGIGRKQSAIINKANILKKDSIGMRVMQERIDNLNKLQDNKIVIDITDIDENGNTGTRVSIHFPAELITTNKSR
jgi:ligand-binding sensor domain-containing protein